MKMQFFAMVSSIIIGMIIYYVYLSSLALYQALLAAMFIAVCVNYMVTRVLLFLAKKLKNRVKRGREQ